MTRQAAYWAKNRQHSTLGIWEAVCTWIKGLVCSGHSYFVPTETHMPQKLTRTQIKQGLDQIPIETLLSSGEGKKAKITGKMKAFAHAVALGETKAQAYRQSYKPNATKRTMACKPYELMRDERIKREVEAYRLALEAEKHRNPIQLKALLVQQLVQHSLDEDFPPAQRMKALQLIGQLFEVGAFLERKETTVVHKSTDIRTRLLERLGTLTDVNAKMDEGLALMDEIKGGDTVSDAVYETPTEGAPAQNDAVAVACAPHTIPNIQTSNKTGVGVSKNPDTVLDFDKE